jgi:hypothetical protein
MGPVGRGAMYRGWEGGRVISYSVSPSLEDVHLGGGVHPLPFLHPIGGMLISLSLHPHALTRGMSPLPPCGIRGQVSIS